MICCDLGGACLPGSTSFLVTSLQVAPKTHDQRHTYLSSASPPFVRCPIAGKRLDLGRLPFEASDYYEGYALASYELENIMTEEKEPATARSRSGAC
jgi:hypothetical protein